MAVDDFTINVCIARVLNILLAALRTHIYFDKEERKKTRKKRKKKAIEQAGRCGLSRFLTFYLILVKIKLLHQKKWQNPQGSTLKNLVGGL